MKDVAFDVQAINLVSLNLVHDELVSTIEQSATRLEQFSVDRENRALLQDCIDGINQIKGTLNLVQLHGADLLAAELLELINETARTDNALADSQLGVLTSTYFILPRYIEYTLQTGRGMPVLLLPHINELRSARKALPLLESHFFTIDPKAQRIGKGQGGAVFGEDLAAFVRRFRHMYQVALLNILRGRQIKASLSMMQRAMIRLNNICEARPVARLWWVASIALGAMAETGVGLNKSRKMLLGALDRQIKQLQAKGSAGLDKEADDRLLKEFVYLAAISGSDSAQELLTTFKASKLSYNDAGLHREMESLQGPSANTLSTMAAVLKDELQEAKVVLERASLGGAVESQDCTDLVEKLTRVAEILAVVGLTSAAKSLKIEIEKIEAWKGGDNTPDAKEMVEIADALLYVESTVSSIDKLNLSDEMLAEVNQLGRREVMARSQLAEAEAVVFDEAESGLALVKRALNSFAEADYDRVHIQNVASTLTTVRGAMVVLSLNRAAVVVENCVAFIEESLMKNSQPAALQQLLETFADAIISLEYYLDAAKNDKNTDASVLEIAEESLAALGFSAGL